MTDIKVAVTGAAGQIAYQLIFSILRGEVFGNDTKVQLHLVDIPQMRDKVNAVLMEIEDCAPPLLTRCVIASNQELDIGFLDIDFAFLVGASPRLAGMERADLLSKNGAIFKQQGEALNQYAKSSCQVLVVGNPCNTNCFIAMSHAPNIPNRQFFSMMMLDENRARYQIAKKLDRSVDDIEDLYIFGNHSATQFPDYFNAHCQGKPLTDLLDEEWLSSEFVPLIQTRGARVIEARGASSAASAAWAAIKTARLIVSKSSTPFSVGLCSEGEYGSQPGLIVSMPCYFKDDKITVNTTFGHQGLGLELKEQSFDELVAECKQVQDLGLLD